MSDDEDEKPKGFDISKLNAEMSDEERKAADDRLKEQFKELAEGNVTMADALRGVGGISAIEDAVHSANGLQDAISATGLGTIQEAMRVRTGLQNQINDAMGGLATSGIQDHLSALTGAGVMDQFRAERTALEKARKLALRGLPKGYMDGLLGAQGVVSRIMS